MQRTTVMADEETLEKLRALARQRGVSFAEVVRAALDEMAAAYHPKPSSIGVGQSDPARTARDEGSRRQPPRSWR
jgi:hypothetical protein